MTHLRLHTPAPRRGVRVRATAARIALICAVAFGIVPMATPCLAGTVVKGRVQVPAAVVAKNGQARELREALSATEAIVYVTEVPGSTRLPGRGKKRDVELRGDRFEPRAIDITVESTVRFRNRDTIFHSILSVDSSGRSELGNMAPGDKRQARFDRAGVVNLFCQLHPGAEGYVIVCPNWFHTRASSSGEYALPSLPRGRYVVHAWHPRLGATRRSVEVNGRDVLRLDLSF